MPITILGLGWPRIAAVRVNSTPFVQNIVKILHQNDEEKIRCIKMVHYARVIGAKDLDD
ncbi:hypothetical protein [Pleionea litopenaei]|uniref:Uncharacterized protein n=1 Tax=Pleionea litopenaei TaxID=3070815 RepID=A0AA51RRF4_9GAMM|nr:hypothetical protein [Pleionea sp. HL-JVS1]WMS86256.1 hypothetical protein Q9312_13610 [Pleionea sp. HL-JVS1]